MPNAPAPAHPAAGYAGVLTRVPWKGVIDFAKAVDARIVTSFSVGEGSRDASGVADPFMRADAITHISSARQRTEPDTLVCVDPANSVAGTIPARLMDASTLYGSMRAESPYRPSREKSASISVYR